MIFYIKNFSNSYFIVKLILESGVSGIVIYNYIISSFIYIEDIAVNFSNDIKVILA